MDGNKLMTCTFHILTTRSHYLSGTSQWAIGAQLERRFTAGVRILLIQDWREGPTILDTGRTGSRILHVPECLPIFPAALFPNTIVESLV